MGSTVQINVVVSAEADPIKVGDALAQLIKAVTPAAVLVEASQDVLDQISSQCRDLAFDRVAIELSSTPDWAKDEVLEALNLKWDNPPDEPQLNN
ncbi:MAG TPA: hypothetical protein V6C65_40240 [Allocoleopsis sp.]